MQSFPVELVRNVVDLVVEFGKIAGGSPEQAVLLLVGAILMGFTTLVFAYLLVGAIVRPLGNLPTLGKGHTDRREEGYREGTGGREKKYLEGESR